MIIVADTNVLVSALLRPDGPPGRLVDLVLARQATLAIDERIFAEYAELLGRPEFGFPGPVVAALLDDIWRSSERVRPSALPIRLPDPDDQMFIEVAVAALASLLVTGNGRHFPPAQRWGVRVVTPREALEIAITSGGHG